MKTLFALVISACAVAAGASVASTPAATDALVTRDSRSLPAGCSPREVAGLLNGFFDAFNRGDMQALDEIWTSEDSPGRPVGSTGREFLWYAVTEGGSIRRGPWRHRSIYDRPELLGYFAERHGQNERMELVAVRATRATEPWRVGVSFVVRRTADDLPSGLGGRQRIAGGKGVVDCERRRLQMWAMGMSTAEPDQDYPPGGARVPCPRPGGWSPANPVVACSSGANAPTVSDEFRVSRASSRDRCAARPVSLRVTRALSAFNTGLADVFARQLVRAPAFRARQRMLRSRHAITRYALARYHAGEGWTATQLERLRRAGRYRLSLSVVHQTRTIARGSVLLTVNCASGLISSWLGPAVRTPT
jgi:hypothetical protein